MSALVRHTYAVLVASGAEPETGATNARMTAQGTEAGQRVSALAVVDGDVWAAYGDYGANDGPIHAQRLNPATLAWNEDAFAMQTEESVVPIEMVDGRLVVAHRDPVGASLDTYSERSTGGAWSSQQFTGADSEAPVHVFHMVEHEGVLWACGARDAATAATVWASDDGGATWAVSRSGSDPDSRFYTMAVVGDALLVQEAAAEDVQRWTDADGWTVDAEHPAIVDSDGSSLPGFAWRDGWIMRADLGSWLIYVTDTDSQALASGQAAITPDGRLHVAQPTGHGAYGLSTYEATGALDAAFRPAMFRLRDGETVTALVGIDNDTLIAGTSLSRAFALDIS